MLWMFATLAFGALPPVPFEASTTRGVESGGVAAVKAGFALEWSRGGAGVAAGELVALRQVGRAIPARPLEPMVVLANGDVIAGASLGGDTSALRFRPATLTRADGDWSIPLSAIRAVWIDAPPADLPADPARYPWDDGGKRDALLLRNRDVVRGDLQGLTLDPPVARFKTADKPAEPFAFTKVAAMAFDPTLARVRKPKVAYARLTLADGSRVSVSRVEADAETVTATALFGPTLRVAWKDVIALDILQGKATALGDLKPKAAEHVPFGGVAWPAVVDRSARGEPLRLTTPSGVSTFDRGLGLHPRTRLVYDLAGKYRRFEALVGLDAVSGQRGAASVTISLDGKPLAIEGLTNLTAASATLPLSIDLTGVKELTLLVDFGPGGDVQDDVNFADARLIE